MPDTNRLYPELTAVLAVLALDDERVLWPAVFGTVLGGVTINPPVQHGGGFELMVTLSLLPSQAGVAKWIPTEAWLRGRKHSVAN